MGFWGRFSWSVAGWLRFGFGGAPLARAFTRAKCTTGHGVAVALVQFLGRSAASPLTCFGMHSAPKQASHPYANAAHEEACFSAPSVPTQVKGTLRRLAPLHLLSPTFASRQPSAAQQHFVALTPSGKRKRRSAASCPGPSSRPALVGCPGVARCQLFVGCPLSAVIAVFLVCVLLCFFLFFVGVCVLVEEKSFSKSQVQET